jgi:hypothetical protein
MADLIVGGIAAGVACPAQNVTTICELLPGLARRTRPGRLSASTV